MRGPLAFVVDGKHVSARTEGLRMSWSAYGGDRALSGAVKVPRHFFDDLGPGVEVQAHDARTAATVWQGHAENPGLRVGALGEEYDLVAFGGALRLQAAATPLGYVVRDLSLWERSPNTQKGAQTRNDERADESPTLAVYANDGKNVSTAWRGEYVLRALKRAGLELGWVYTEYDAGVADDDYRMRLLTGTSPASLTMLRDYPAATTANSMQAQLSTVLPSGHSVAAVRAARVDTAVAATDDHWFEFWNLAASQVRLALDGSTVTAGTYNTGKVYAHDVIADMLARGMAPGADTAKASVASFSFGIDTLDWLDGVTMGDALEALRIFEPDLFWTLYGDKFTAAAWDDDNPRYVVSKRDGGITKPGREFSECNRVLVTWTDDRGRERTTTFDLDNGTDAAEYEAAGYPMPSLTYTRDADPISLPEGVGSEANARRVAIHVLGQANDPPASGTAVVGRRIRDLWSGADVYPHEIRPGCAVLEQETGQSYRLTEVEYVDGDGASALTLGEPVRSTEQVVARLARVNRRRRRRG